MDPVPFTIACAIATALVTAVGALWRRAIITDRRNEARERDSAQREAVAAKRCEKEIERAVDRIQHLENRSHADLSSTISDQREMMGQCLQTMQECATAINSMVHLEKTKQTASGMHPTVKET